MDPVSMILIGGALHKWRTDSKYKQAKDISKKAVERVVEAEMKYEVHQKNLSIAYDNLCTRVSGMIDYLSGPFAAMFRPFEHTTDSYMEDLFGQTNINELKYVKRIEQTKTFRQLPMHKKQSGTAAAVTFLLFGTAGEASRQLDTAKTQRSVSYLVAEHCDTFCTVLDLQRERYMRVYQLLGALNVALLRTSMDARKALNNIQWLLDEDGHIPRDLSATELKIYLSEEGLAQFVNSINISKVIFSILAEPLFDQSAELTRKAEQLLTEGERALQQIQNIQSRRG